MPQKRKAAFTRIKRGRYGDGKGGCGYGRGGWLGRIVDLEVKHNATDHSASQPTSEHTSEIFSAAENSHKKSNEISNSSAGIESQELQFADRSEIKMEEIELPVQEIVGSCTPDFLSLIPEVQAKICQQLPLHWISICDSQGVSVLLLSRDVEMSTQRRVFVSFIGDVTVSVHRKKLSEDILTKSVRSIKSVSLSQTTVENFAEYVILVMNEIRKFEVCVGCNCEEYEPLSKYSYNHGSIDSNPYGETRYSKTFRSHGCQLLILPSKWRCMKCYNLSENLRKKYRATCSDVKVHTPNIHLSEAQKVQKLSSLQRKLEVSKRLISRLKHKIDIMHSSPVHASHTSQ